MRTVQLADVCQVVMGQAPASDSYNDDGRGFPLVAGAGDMKAGHIVPTKYTTAPSKLSRPDDVIIGIRASIGMRAQSPEAVCLGRGVAALRPSPELYRGYLWHWVEASASRLAAKGRGATFLQVSRKDIAEMEIPLPPLEEQQRIADILDRVDSLRAQRRAAITQLDSLSRSIFLEMFGDPRSNPYGWKVHKIADVVRDFRGGASLSPDDLVAIGFPVLHKGAIKKNGGIGIDPKKKTFARNAYAAANQRSQVDRSFAAVTLRDLVPAGPTIGLVADLRHGPSDRYLLAQGVYGFHVDEDVVVSEYLVALSNMPTFRHVLRQNAVGSTQIHIRTPIYLNIKIPTPPLVTQLEFARRVTGLRQVGRTQSASLDELDVLFASVQYRAFKGAL